jgi:4'-phosphopantetheinyl transferase
MRLGPHEIAVWTVGLDAPDAPDCLTAEELALANRAVDPVHRRRRVRARSALRRILAAYVGAAPAALNFVTAAHGKPHLEGGPPFNLSHSGDTMLLAVATRGTVGVDIEDFGRLDGDWRAVTQRVFSDAERAQLERMAPQDRPGAALRGWVRKEAYTKARGAGFAYGFTAFTVTLDADPSDRSMLLEDAGDPAAPAGWRLRDLVAPPGFAASLAHAGSALPVRYRDYRELAA